LTLNGCGLSTYFLEGVSTGLPSLTNLTLEDCNIVGDNSLEFPINMEHTKFDVLTVSLWINFGYLGNVRIQQLKEGVKDRYHTTAHYPKNRKYPKTCHTLLQHSSQKEHQKIIDTAAHALRVSIRCHSIKELKLSLHSEEFEE
jgi:hypothetical protein